MTTGPAARSVLDILAFANERGEIGYAHGGENTDLPLVREAVERGFIRYSHDASVCVQGRPFQRRDIYTLTRAGGAYLSEHRKKDAS